MSRVRNAYEFLRRLRAIAVDYELLFRPSIESIRDQFSSAPFAVVSGTGDESLEAHSRAYFVNGLLAALNWRLDAKPEEGLPNLFPEAPVASSQTGRRRFLDYLGFERMTTRPLLVVETKRPAAQLPRLAQEGYGSFGRVVPGSIAEVISLALKGESLMGPWNTWLGDLKDYVLSVDSLGGTMPARVVITNGSWLVLFVDPADAFLPNGSRNVDCIMVFDSRDTLEERYIDIYKFLSHAAVSKVIPPLSPGQVALYVSASDIARTFHGLYVRYFEKGIFQLSPIVTVAPILYLQTRFQVWIRVEAQPSEYDLPRDPDGLQDHLAAVRAGAEELLAAVNRCLGAAIRPTSLAQHYADEESFDVMKGIVEVKKDSFIVLTGDKTHYLLPEPSVPDCPFHKWNLAREAGVSAGRVPLLVRSVSPRSFFISGEVHHCAHRDVASVKETPVLPGQGRRRGLRSIQEGGPFCEIWPFEEHLCCRTCAFEEVCTQSEAFQLPCRRP